MDFPQEWGVCWTGAGLSQASRWPQGCRSSNGAPTRDLGGFIPGGKLGPCVSLGVPVGSSLHQLPCVRCHVIDRSVWFISSELGLCPSSPWGQLLLPTNGGFSEPWEIPKRVLLVFPRIPVTLQGLKISQWFGVSAPLPSP